MRNPSIDIYKFFASLMIAIFHFYGRSTPREHFPLGGVIVEFFVLTSGVFFYSKWERVKQKEIPELYPYQYIKKRFWRFFPHNLGGVIFAVFVGRIYLGGGLPHLKTLGIWLSGDIWEILLIKMNGLNQNGQLQNGPAWTISAMFIAEFVIICCLVNWEKVFYTFICPISILIGYGYWRNAVDVRNGAWIGFTTFGVMRVFIVMCLAWYCYHLALYIEKTDFTKKGILFLTLCEMAAYGSVLIIIMYGTTRNFRWLATLILIFGVALSTSKKTYLYLWSTKINGVVTSWLARLSFDIYLTHEAIIKLYTHFYPDKYDMYRQKFSFLLVCLLTAFIFEFVIVTSKKCSQKVLSSLKSQILERAE